MGVSLLHASAAVDFVKHGRALAALSGSATRSIDGRVLHDAAARAESLTRALSACPDSTVASLELAHQLRAGGQPLDAQIQAFARVVDQQPFHVEAWISIGNAHAAAERYAEAREAFETAASVDPGHPALLRNQLLIALRLGRVDDVLESLARLAEEDALEAAWLKRSAAELLLAGRPHLALPLLERVDPELVVARGEQAFALSQKLASDGDALLADGMRALAQLRWAREHIELDDPAAAVRSYRQAISVARGYPDLPGGARRLQLELAAALCLSERVEDARAELDGLEPRPVDWVELPIWGR